MIQHIGIIDEKIIIGKISIYIIYNYYNYNKKG